MDKWWWAIFIIVLIVSAGICLYQCRGDSLDCSVCSNQKSPDCPKRLEWIVVGRAKKDNLKNPPNYIILKAIEKGKNIYMIVKVESSTAEQPWWVSSNIQNIKNKHKVSARQKQLKGYANIPFTSFYIDLIREGK